MSKKLQNIQRKLEKIGPDIVCGERRSSIVLEGTVNHWEEVVAAGKLAAGKGYKGVVNRIEVRGMSIPAIKQTNVRDSRLENKQVDVLVIGAGIIGSAIARELSKWDMAVLLVDKEEDVAMHTSSRNNGMVHSGAEPKPGSKKAMFNIQGNEMYPEAARQLGVPFQQNGSYVLYDKKWLQAGALLFLKRAKTNGVKGARNLTREEVKRRMPALTDHFAGAVYFPNTGVVSPYQMTIAYAENAILNGVELSLNTIVLAIEKKGNRIISVQTNRGTVFPKVVINSAGVYADTVANMAGDQFFTIHPRKGEIVFLDSKKGDLIKAVIGSLNLHKSDTKGGGIVKTVDGNILIGPDAYEQPFREDFSTHSLNIKAILDKHLPLVPALSEKDVITYCAGVRAATYEEDFIVEQSEYVENFVYAAGIQSPGLASAPAIAKEIEQITCRILRKNQEVKKKAWWNPYRREIPRLAKMNWEQRQKFIIERPDYGQIICRCEEISRGEIADSINSLIPVRTVDGIKRRVRAGMGRCQGGFCLPGVMEVLKEEAGEDILKITKKGGDSQILAQFIKGEEPIEGNEE